MLLWDASFSLLEVNFAQGPHQRARARLNYIFLVVFHGQQLGHKKNSGGFERCLLILRAVIAAIPITPAIICCERINAYRIRHNASHVTTEQRGPVHSPNIIEAYRIKIYYVSNFKELYVHITYWRRQRAYFFRDMRKKNTHPHAYMSEKRSTLA